MIAKRIARGLVTTHCSLRAINGTGEMRSYKMGPSMRKAGLVLMAVLGSSPTALAAGDSSAGQTVFATHCVACHSTQPGKTRSGHRSPALSVARAPRFQGTISLRR